MPDKPEPAPIYLQWASLEQLADELKNRPLADFFFAWTDGEDWTFAHNCKYGNKEIARMLTEVASRLLLEEIVKEHDKRKGRGK